MEKERLTNEVFKNKFVNHFELVNYAIKMAENMIKTGRAPRIKIDSENPALLILAEIANNKDTFEDFQEIIPAKTAAEIDEELDIKAAAIAIQKEKGHERKKVRITL